MGRMGSVETKKLRNFSWPSLSFGRVILSSLFFQWGMLMTFGLQLTNVTVPTSAILGGTCLLACEFQLDKDTLQSLKFYRDGHEFFRYSPGNRDSSITTFPLQGVHVDLGETLQVQHNSVSFRLKNLDVNSGGTFRCEDAPSFQTLHGEGNLSIIALPSSPKLHLTGLPSTVQIGDRINGNCSFAETFPAAELSLYLNNQKTASSHVFCFPYDDTRAPNERVLNPVKEFDVVIINSSDEVELISYKPIKLGQRFTSILGVKLRAAPKYFQKGVILIKCNAKLFDQRWETMRNITNQNYQPPFYTAGQNRYSSGSDGSDLPLRGASICVISILTFLFFR